MTRNIFICFFASLIVCGVARGETLDLDTALRNTYYACADIDENLYELKALAGVNTAVTAVGTGLGVGATAAGIAKAKLDKEIENLLSQIHENANLYQGDDPSEQEKDEWYRNFVMEMDSVNWNDVQMQESQRRKLQELSDSVGVVKEKEEKSKKLGNWRTGLLAGNTATNVAGAIIASQTINKGDIQAQVDACISATNELNNAIMAARMNGEEISEAQNIYKACREYEYIDISPISKRGRGAMISASIGAGLGGIGTITSGVANSDKIRNNDTEAGKQKEKNLNTASNVLAVGATAASATATVFNATQIAAIKKIAKVSESCSGVLK